MLVIVASRYDMSAVQLAEQWDRTHCTALLSVEDLSTAGWRYLPDAPHRSTAVIHGEVVPVSAIRGVLTRRPAVVTAELLHITPGDRTYVAAEMTAFLLAFLSGLRCPVLNRPTPLSLCGPSMRREQWVQAAAQCGIPTVPACRHLCYSSEEEREILPLEERVYSAGGKSESGDTAPRVCAEVTVIGERVLNESGAPPGVEEMARRLSRAVGTPLLQVRFTGKTVQNLCFESASALPPVTSEQRAGAILDYLCAMGGRG